MAAAVLLALALAASPPAAEGRGEGAPDPCVATDALGRSFRTCFDPGRGLDLSFGASFGGEAPVEGGASDVRLAYRWRGDIVSPAGSLEWLRDMAFLEARGLFTNGDTEPRAAHALLWRGLFVRHRASPFLLVPGPRPIRFPFPFDVGLLVEAGGGSWDRARPRDAFLAPVRSALLLDLGGHGVLRRLAFGPEVAWTVRISESAPTVHGIVPFTAGVLDARAESRDGLSALGLAVRGGSSLSVPGGAAGFVEATLAVERVVFAVNDRPFALYAEGALRGGGGRGRSAEAGLGLRAGLGR
ncbi:MAG TPA: hypothetical protein VIW03_09795 [Anaeromyxobacter sp.]